MTWPYEIGQTVKRREIHELLGGTRQSGIVTLRSRPDILLFTDPEKGARHGYDKFEGQREDGTYSYTNAGQEGYAAGQLVFRSAGWNDFRSAGWNEWKGAWPAIANKATLQQQYNCHVAAGSYGLLFTGEYNLERFRANKSNWARTVLKHRCNW